MYLLCAPVFGIYRLDVFTSTNGPCFGCCCHFQPGDRWYSNPPSLCFLRPFTQRTYYVESDHNWKNDFFIECLSPILEAMTNAKQQIEYDQLLALDRSARDFYVPPILGELENSTETPRFLVMQRGLVIMGREIGASFLSLSLSLIS